MKRNLLYISLIVFLLLLIFALIFIIVNLSNKKKIVLPPPVTAGKGVTAGETKTETEPVYPEYLKYGIKPKEAKYYERQ